MRQEIKDKLKNGNVIIALFMGAIIDPETEDYDWPTFIFKESPSNNSYHRYTLDYFIDEIISDTDKFTIQRYDNSWDWIIPVVKKCRFESSILKDDFEKLDLAIQNSLCNCEISNVFETVLNFINHNNN